MQNTRIETNSVLLRKKGNVYRKKDDIKMDAVPYVNESDNICVKQTGIRVIPVVFFRNMVSL